MDRETLSPGHVFISYVREDAPYVDDLQAVLDAARIRVWRDTEELWPGQDWRLEIRRAIQTNSLVFLACFSENTDARETSYQNEELLLAVEQMRIRQPGRPWLIPIRFSESTVPSFDLGAGRDLHSLQRVDLFGSGKERGSARLVSAVIDLLASRVGDKGAGTVTARPPRAEPVTVGESLKRFLLEPSRQIELEDLINGVIGDVRRHLLDESKFPFESSLLTDSPSGYRYMAEQVRRYEEAISPLVDLLIPGCTWGHPEHNGLWARTLQAVSRSSRSGGGRSILINLQRYPLLVALYAGSIAALQRKNFGALKAIAIDAKSRDQHLGPISVIGSAHVWRPFEGNEITANLLAFEDGGNDISDEDIRDLQSGRKGKRHTPVSDHLHNLLRSKFSDLIPDDSDYVEAFDETEFFLSLLAADAQLIAREQKVYLDGAWFGSFTWRNRYHLGTSLEQGFKNDLDSNGEDWEPLRAGLFGGSTKRAHSAFENVAAGLQETRWRRF